jgi:hypothetical protein
MFEQIKNRSHGLSYAHSMNSSNVTLGEISEMQNEHAGDFAVSPEVFRDGHVQLRRHYIGKVVKAQRSLMAVDSLLGLSTIPGPERPKHQIRALASRKAGQPIDSAMFPNPVFCLNVVRVSILREPRSFSLFRREETLLVFSNLVEPFGGLSSLVVHITILQLI